jgi:TolA-binding protein
MSDLPHSPHSCTRRKRPLAGALAAAAVAAWSGCPLTTGFGQAQPAAGAAAEVYTKAMTAFGSGDFPAAIAGLEQMISLGAEGPGMESVHYSLAAAHFNQKDLQKAKAAFETYLKLYPSGVRTADAMLAVAQIEALLGNKIGAAARFSDVAKMGGANREQAVLAQAVLLKEGGSPGEAAALLQEMVSGGLRTPETVQAALLLASVEAAHGERTKALGILSNLTGRLLPLIDNPLQLNSLAFEIGDSFLNAGEFKQALTAYGMVRRREDTVLLQQQRIQTLARRYEANAAAAKAEPSRAVELATTNQRIKTLVDQCKVTLEEAGKSAETLPALRARQAAAFQGLGKLEEAVLIFESLLTQSDPATRAGSLFSLGALHSQLGEAADCVRVLETYRKEFQTAKNMDAALLLQGTNLLQLDRNDDAAACFEALLARKPEGPHHATALFLLGNTRFSQSRYGDALETYKKYLKRYAKEEFAEEASYRGALSQFFSGQYGPALEAFEAYQKKHPNGLYVPDAEYRIAACYSAGGKPAEVVKLCTTWEARHGDHPVSGDVLSLHADALVALDKREQAIALYRKSSVCASTDEVVHYSLFAANKELQRLGRWAESADMFREFLAAKPNHSSQVLAMYWLARALYKEGKPEEAKSFLSSKIRLFIEDRSQDAVEQLLSQLAQLCAKPPRPAVVPAAQNGSASPGQEPPQSPPKAYVPEAEMSAFLEPKDFPDTPLVKARLLFARSELARMTKKPEDSAALLDRMCSEIPPDALGASLLAQCADRLLERGEAKKASKFYEELLRSFPKADLLDYAYNGLGQIALLEKRPADALLSFEAAVDKAGAANKLREVTLGRAKALLQLDRVDEARPVLEQVASTREWRGEATAEAVLLLGEVLARKGDLAGAIQYFQRVFVAYQRYEKQVARAYLRAAECFEQLQEPEKAAAHYRELGSKPKLAHLPEVAVARGRLKTEAPR